MTKLKKQYCRFCGEEVVIYYTHNKGHRIQPHFAGRSTIRCEGSDQPENFYTTTSDPTTIKPKE